jgi:S-DNA-T family DNA segregation ATPase FtsK/SpoIIIE
MRKEPHGKRHEILGVLLLMLAILVFACLISFNRWDTSFDTQSYKSYTSNRVGKVGAYVSDCLFQTFGLSAFLLLFPMTILGWKLIRGKNVSSPIMRTLGFCLLVCAASITLQRIPIHRFEGSFEPGGVLGDFLAGVFVANLNTTGTYVVVAAMFILGLLTATSFSFASIFNRESNEERPARIGIWERLKNWRRNSKRVRAVVNIKTPVPKAPETAPRPAPIRPSSAPLETHPPAIVPPLEPVPSRVSADDKLMRATRKFILPSVELLTPPEGHFAVDEAELMERARQLAEKCAEFDVHGTITQIHPGPVVTTFEFKPDAGVKYSKVTSLVDDLCLGVKADSIRIDRIPGKATVGIEIPNAQRETIMLRALIESEVFRKSSSKLTLALGKLINGNVYVTDLARMPHLLIAGATGAGKSVALNCMITSILYKATPEDVRLILIDPKRLELGIYAHVPHLLTPIVTDAKEAANALRWATSEMEARYHMLAQRGVRTIEHYNAKIRSTGRQLSFLEPKENNKEGEPEKTLPYLVLVIDELADLMIVSSHEVEESISRLAAMARAVGIHLILATQRPSVDVITGVIKANFPCRIAFKVATKVDSRTIIDANGAEQLLGNGDMLFIPPGSARLTRIHGSYVSEKEAQNIVDHLRRQGRPIYDDSVLSYGEEELDEGGNPVDSMAEDNLYKDAVRIVVSEGRASTSLLQRRLSIGYGRAAKLVDTMHRNGLVGPADGSKPREVLVGLDFLERL